MRCRLLACSFLLLASCTSDRSGFTGRPNSTWIDPGLTFDEPTRAAWVAAGDFVASGTQVGLQHLELDGLPAEVDGEIWRGHTVLEPGVHTLEVRGLDGEGAPHFLRRSVMAGEFGSDQDPIFDGLRARLRRETMERVSAQIDELLPSEALEKILVEGDPIPLGSQLMVKITDLQYEEIEMGLDTGDGWFNLDVRLDDVFLGVELDGIVGLTQKMRFGTVRVHGRYGADVDANGKIKLRALEAWASLENTDFSLIPNVAILEQIVANSLSDLASQALEKALPSMVEDMTDELTSLFAVSLPDARLHPHTRIGRLVFDSDGVEVGLDMWLPFDRAPMHTAPGPLMKSGRATEPNPDADVSISVSDDLLNYVSFQTWRAGAMDIAVSTEDGSLDLSRFLGDSDIAPEVVTLAVNPSLPPIVTQQADMTAVQFGEIDTTLRLVMGGIEHDITVALSGQIAAEPKVDRGMVSTRLAPPELQFTVRETNSGLPATTLTRIFEEGLPMDTLLETAEALSIPLPTLGVFSIDQASVHRQPGGATRFDIQFANDN